MYLWYNALSITYKKIILLNYEQACNCISIVVSLLEVMILLDVSISQEFQWEDTTTAEVNNVNDHVLGCVRDRALKGRFKWEPFWSLRLYMKKIMQRFHPPPNICACFNTKKKKTFSCYIFVWNWCLRKMCQVVMTS